MSRTDTVFIGLGGLWLAAFGALALGAAPSDEGGSAAAAESTAAGSSAAAETPAEGIVEAAQQGRTRDVAALLAAGADVGARSADGSTALHWAVYGQNKEMAAQLVAKGADVSAATREGMTPLALAAVNGDAGMIALLLDAGADVNAALARGETPLMLAARTGKTDAIALLLDRGAAIDAVESVRGTTALMWAAANRNPGAVKLLLERGANPALQSAPAPLPGNPYLAPSAKSRVDAYKIGYLDPEEQKKLGIENVTEEQRLRARASLLDNVAQEQLAELQKKKAAERTPVASATGRPPPDTMNRGGGLTPLIFAAREGDLESAKILIDAGADVNQTSKYGWTPLLTAVQNRYYQLADYLLEHGADPNIANQGGWSPLYIATDNRNIEGGDYPTRRPDMDHLVLIGKLLEHGADPNIRMKSSTETRTVFTNQWLRENGATPLLRAAQSGDLKLIRLLLAYGADPNLTTDENITPLMVASGIGWVEGVTFEWSPEQTTEVVKLLLKLGNDPNAQDTTDGRTALMGAAHKGRSDVVQILVDAGADLNAHDVGSRDTVHTLYGVTWRPVDYADGLVRVGVQSAVGHPETAALIRKLMRERGLPTPPEGRTIETICIVEVCKPPA